MVGQDADAVRAALRAKGIAFHEEEAGTGKRITYSDGDARVELALTLWPIDSAAPASAWDPDSKSPKRLTLTHICDLAPGSDERRAWVRSYEKEGHRWAYLSEKASAQRTAEDRAKYPVAAWLQWSRTGKTEPWATFLFQAARPAGSPPGVEGTALDVYLENPHRPRRY